MGKIFINRKSALTGVAVRIICYLDDQEICKLGENESFAIEKENGTHTFKCKMTMVYSDDFEIKLSGDDIVNINVKPGTWKPKVEISKGDKSQLSEIQRYIDSADFVPTNKVGNYFHINEEKKQWAIPRTILKSKVDKVYSYEDIISYELIEDGNTITKGGIGGAVAGGLLFGEAGAIAGGTIGKKKGKATCTMLKIKITVKDSKEPAVYINMLGGEFKKSGMIYQTAYDNAQKILSLLQIICDDNANSKEMNNKKIDDVPTQIKKYKELLDSGAITQEEYDEKKKQLLEL